MNKSDSSEAGKNNISQDALSSFLGVSAGDQVEAALHDMAALLADYRIELLTRGFTDQESFHLVVELQKALTTPLSGGTIKGRDEQT